MTRKILFSARRICNTQSAYFQYVIRVISGDLDLSDPRLATNKSRNAPGGDTDGPSLGGAPPRRYPTN